MVENIVENIIQIFNGVLGKESIVFIISCLPILELRGGLIAAALLDLNPITSYIISIIGNMLPIPFILWLITPIFNWLKKRKSFTRIIERLENKTLSKKDALEKGEFWGLMIFVGIPLPGTGAWTGALLAALLGMDKKKAFISIFCGVIIASIIMMIVSYGLLGLIIK